MTSNVTLAECKAIMPLLLQQHIPVMLHGSMGIGKTSLLKQVALDFNMELLIYSLSSKEPVDLMGIPHIKAYEDGRLYTDRTQFAPPSEIPLAGDPLPEGKDGWILAFDEVLNGSPEVIKTLYGVVQDHAIDNIKLHPSVFIVAAGNIASDGVELAELPPPLNNRMAHLHIKTDVEGWLQHVANVNSCNSLIQAYIGLIPSNLHNYNQGDYAFPTPRSLENVSKMLAGTITDLNDQQISAMCALVGEGIAFELLNLSTIKIPDIDKIILGRTRIPKDAKPDLQWLIATGLSEKVTPSNVGSIVTILENQVNIIEIAVITVNKIVHLSHIQPHVTKNQIVQSFLSKHFLTTKEL